MFHHGGVLACVVHGTPMQKAHLFEPIPFVKANASNEKASVATKQKNLPVADGTEIRKFYEELVSEPASSKSKSKVPVKASISNKRSHKKTDISSNCGSKTVSVNQFLRAAQEGDLECVKHSLSEGININVTDKFGWTALMCAAFSGETDTVDHLLTNGADKTVRNSNDDTALSLARIRKRKEVINRLENRTDDTTERDCDGSSSQQPSAEQFYCDVCKTAVLGVTEATHSTSTVHLINLNVKPSTSNYAIPETNRGFQLMLKTGWNKEAGLGSEGQGLKYPVKTVLKRNRRGFGSDDKTAKAKVTHFSANDAKAVERATSSGRLLRATTLGKRQISKKLLKDKQRERDFRREFY